MERRGHDATIQPSVCDRCIDGLQRLLRGQICPVRVQLRGLEVPLVGPGDAIGSPVIHYTGQVQVFTHDNVGLVASDVDNEGWNAIRL